MPFDVLSHQFGFKVPTFFGRGLDGPFLDMPNQTNDDCESNGDAAEGDHAATVWNHVSP